MAVSSFACGEEVEARVLHKLNGMVEFFDA